MHWKYHLEAGDAVKVATDDGIGWGTVRGWPKEENPPEGCSLDNYELSDFTVRVQSGQWEGNVTLDNVEEYQSKNDRDTDLPLLSEDLRLGGGIKQDW